MEHDEIHKGDYLRITEKNKRVIVIKILHKIKLAKPIKNPYRYKIRFLRDNYKPSGWSKGTEFTNVTINLDMEDTYERLTRLEGLALEI